nr:caspase family protein [Actinomycetota bacterium]
MTKIALCIGQNKYQRNDITPLRGCVNDTLLIGEMLRRAGFEVRLVHNQAATQRGILDRLSIEVAKLRAGDFFVFWNSSHGYQVNDREGDELYDYRDEAICTYDTDPRDPFTDDKLGRILYRADPEATIFLGSDSCHSGSLTREML